MIFAKNAFLKLENIHKFDTYFHPLRNIVLKLFGVKFRHNHIRWIDIQEVAFFHAAIVSFGTVTNDDFLVFFSNEKSEYKIVSAKMFAIKLEKE